MNEIASIDKISRTYSQGGKKIEVLHRLSLKVKKGETVAILGQSGSGKSTFLSLLAGLDKPDFGSIEIDGTELTKLNQEDLAHFRSKNLGIVFQQYHLMSNLTALENVSLPLELQRQKEAEPKARKALEQVGLSHRLSHLPSSSPEENANELPWPERGVSNQLNSCRGHPATSTERRDQEVMNLLFKLCREHEQTLILVTHNHELSRLCDRCLELRDGKLHAPKE